LSLSLFVFLALMQTVFIICTKFFEYLLCI
jgi:hypothetical protein